MFSIDEQIKKANVKTVEELEKLLAEISPFEYHVYLCYRRGYYRGVKVSLKISEDTIKYIPENSMYGLPRPVQGTNKILFLNDKEV